MILEKEKFIAFNQPDLGEEEMSAVMDVIRSGWIGTGKVSHQFEEEFADFLGGGYCVAVSSCTMGLQLALSRLPFKSRITTTPLTFAATILRDQFDSNFLDDILDSNENAKEVFRMKEVA